jgi:hypothetical protein
MTAKSVITTLVTGVITISQIPDLYAHLETIFVVRKGIKKTLQKEK